MSRLSLNQDNLPLSKLKDITMSGTKAEAIRKAVFFTIKHYKIIKASKEPVKLAYENK